MLYEVITAAPTILGHNVFFMNGTNMEPAIPDKSAIWVKAGALPEDAVGRVALCKVFENDLTTVLRVVGEETEDSKTVYLMRSDVNTNAEVIRIPSENIIGEAISVSVAAGLILAFISSKLGVIIFIIIPSVLLLVFELIRILKKFSNNDNEELYQADNITLDKHIEKVEKVEEAEEIALTQEPEFVEEIDNNPKVLVDKNGKAEYIKSAETADKKALDKVLLTDPVEFHKTKQPHTNSNQSKSFEVSKDLQNVKNTQALPKSFEFQKNEGENTQFKSSVKPIGSEKQAGKNDEIDPFIAPKTT